MREGRAGDFGDDGSPFTPQAAMKNRSNISLKFNGKPYVNYIRTNVALDKPARDQAS
jgi:hypothetical protein